MNTTDLVHFLRADARRPSISTESHGAKLPPSYHQLAEPVRQGILGARHFLLGAQSHDGYWCGNRRSDLTDACQLIVLRACLGDELSELDHSCGHLCEAILAEQLPSGGWSTLPGKRIDLSMSVQAYLALKLAGYEASDERLANARRAIRRHGGADQADATTRLFLLLLGQIPHENCPLEFAVNLCARNVGLKRGIRELFIRRPNQWPSCAAITIDDLKLDEPLARLSFPELILRRLAAVVVEQDRSQRELDQCEQRIDELARSCNPREYELPRLRREPLVDTANALAALGDSGMALHHEVVARAATWLRNPERQHEWSGTTTELVALIELLATAIVDRAPDGALPPDLHVTHLRSRRRASSGLQSETFVRGAKALLNTLTQHVLAKQNRDGGWGAEAQSSPDITGAVLAALAKCSNDATELAAARGVAYLREQQRADGSWTSSTGVHLVHGTSLAARGLIASGIDLDDEVVATAVNWLLAHQQAGGGWGELALACDDCTSCDEYVPGPEGVVQTAWTVLALIEAGLEGSDSVRRAVDFLLQAQQDDGSWDEPNATRYDEACGRWYHDDLSAVVMPLVALSRWAVRAARRATIDPPRVALKLVGGYPDR